MALTKITSEGIKSGEIKTADISDDAITAAKIANDTINEIKLNIHNNPSGTDKVLGYTANGLEWVTQSGGGSGSTNLSNTANGTSLTVESSSGTNTALPAATTSAWGVMTDEDKTKLDGIEASATADQTNAEIRAAVEAASDSNVFTDADHTKLNGIEASATADQTGAEIKTAYEAESDTNAFTDADHTKLDGIAASANNYSHPNHSGDVTSSGDGATTIANDAVTTAKIADDAVTADKLANSINTEIAANTAKTTNATHSGEVTGSGALTIADDVVDEANLKVDNSPTNDYVLTAKSSAAGGLTWAAASGGVADGGVTTAKLANDAVTGAKIADDAIDSEHYTDGSIDTAHIADLNVTTAKIAADAITGAKIADDAIDSEHYTDGSIDTAHIADNQVTLAKMAGLARGKIIYGDASGDPAALSPGSANQVLTSDGTDISWAAAAGGGGASTGESYLYIRSKNSGALSDSGKCFHAGYQSLNQLVNGGQAWDELDGIFIGHGAGYYVQEGAAAIYIGNGAGQGVNVIEVIGNVAIGDEVLKNATSGWNSTYGTWTMKSTTSGSHQSAFGATALDANTTGGYNAAFGYGSLGADTTGASNSALGYNAGDNITTGSNNIVIGANADASANNASNEITLGDSNIATLRCQVTSISSLSDRRDKTDINTLDLGLDFIDSLKPVKFKWNSREGIAKDGTYEAGFIAQDFQQVQKDNDADYLNLVLETNPEKLEAAPGKLIPILVKAIQELKQEIETLKNNG